MATAVGGCGLQVKPFAGTTIALDIAGASPTAAGTHLEMWGRNGANDIIRISYLVQDKELHALSIRAALDKNDPCMINDTGYLLTDARAYPTSVEWGGVPQTPAEQANQLVLRIKQLTSVAEGGLEPSSLLILTPFDDTPPPSVAADATPDVRKAACNAYWGTDPVDPTRQWTYTGNPLYFGLPLHSTMLGAINYVTQTPQQSFQDIALTSPYDLSDMEEIFFTLETVAPDKVDPAHRGDVWMDGTRVETQNSGRNVNTFNLAGNGVTGNMALIFPQQQSF